MLGKHVIETCIRRPFRRKEAWATRDVLMPHIDRDPSVRHVAMPPAEPHPAGAEGPGPFLEGGDIIVVGRDVLCGATDLTSNDRGRAWLRRYLEADGYRLHPVDVQGTWLHLLGVMCLLREGVVMAHLPALGGRLPDPVADWDLIEVNEEEARMLATVGMSIDQDRHIVDRRFERVIGEIDRPRDRADPDRRREPERLGRGGALRRPADLARRGLGKRPEEPRQQAGARDQRGDQHVLVLGVKAGALGPEAVQGRDPERAGEVAVAAAADAAVAGVEPDLARERNERARRAPGSPAEGSNSGRTGPGSTSS